MSYTKAGLRGAAVHDYREASRATANHYDTGAKQAKHIQPGRFLLKAQPQQGKTGALASNNSFIVSLSYIIS